MTKFVQGHEYALRPEEVWAKLHSLDVWVSIRELIDAGILGKAFRPTWRGEWEVLVSDFDDEVRALDAQRRLRGGEQPAPDESYSQLPEVKADAQVS